MRSSEAPSLSRRAPVLVVAGAVVALVLGAGATAAAFPTGSQFSADPVSTAGGGGLHFTGAPSFEFGTCSACHLDPPGLVTVRLGSSDTSLFAADPGDGSGGYQPGQTYELEVEIMETLAVDRSQNGPARCGLIPRQPFVPCNSNGFALEVDDLLGSAVGALCPTPPVGGHCVRDPAATTILGVDGAIIYSTGYLPPDPALHLPAGFENGATRWHFYFTAPPAKSGPISFHIGAVDGNGGEGTVDVQQDTDGDDSVQAHLTVAERGGLVYAATGNCELGSVGARAARPGGASWLALIAVAGLVGRRSLRRRR